MPSADLKEPGLGLITNVSAYISKTLGCRPITEIRLETPGQNPLAWELSLPLLQALRKLRGFEMSGNLPLAGGAMCVSNHIRELDPFDAYRVVAEMTGRSVRALVRLGLVDPNYRGSEQEQRRRTKKEFGSWQKRYFTAPYLRCFDPIPVAIGTVNVDGLKEARRGMNVGQLIWVFIEGTREPLLGAADYMEGAALLATWLPNIDIYPAGISGDSFGKRAVKIGQPFTYKDLLLEDAELRHADAQKERGIILRRTSEHMVTRIMPLIADPALAESWFTPLRLKWQHQWTKEQMTEMALKHNDPWLEGTAVMLGDMFSPGDLAAFDTVAKWEYVDPNPAPFS